MSKTYVLTSIALIAASTYLIRVMPLLLLKKPIRNRFFRSFLYYAPYATLAVLTFPAILSASSPIASVCGFAVALVAAFFRLGLPLTAGAGCLAAAVAELIFS